MTAAGRVLAFVVVFAAGLFAYLRAADGAAQVFVIEQLTVRPAAAVLAAMAPSAQARAEGNRLSAPGGGLVVRGGCEGVDVWLLLASALLVAPLSWRHRLVGLALGTLWMWWINLVRILLLFAAWRWNPSWFDALHGLLLPMAALLAAALFMLVWAGRPGVAAAWPWRQSVG